MNRRSLFGFLAAAPFAGAAAMTDALAASAKKAVTRESVGALIHSFSVMVLRSSEYRGTCEALAGDRTREYIHFNETTDEPPFASGTRTPTEKT